MLRQESPAVVRVAHKRARSAGQLRLALLLLCFAAASCWTRAWPGGAPRAHGRAAAPGSAAFALLVGSGSPGPRAQWAGPAAAKVPAGCGSPPRRQQPAALSTTTSRGFVCVRPSRVPWPRTGRLGLQMCAPAEAGLQLTYEFEHAGRGRAQPGADAREQVWRRAQVAWSPLQQPVLVGQAVLLFHQKARANMTAVCARVLGAHNSSELGCALAMLGSLVEQETAMREEIAASAQLLLDSSSFRGTHTLRKDGAPQGRRALEAWLGGAGGGAARGGPNASSAASRGELRRLIDECAAWQHGKHREERSVILPLLAFSCLKNVAARRADLDAKTRAQIAAVESWLVSRAALSLTVRGMQDAATGAARGAWRQHRIADDPRGNLQFCTSTAGLLRHELLELSRLTGQLRQTSDAIEPQQQQRQTEEVMGRLGLLVEARRMVYVAVLRPCMPQLHHVCVSVLADQVVQLSSLYTLSQTALRRSSRMRLNNQGTAHASDAAATLERLISFATEHLELEEVRLWPLITRTLTLDKLSSVAGANSGPPPPHVAMAARSIALRLGDAPYDEGLLRSGGYDGYGAAAEARLGGWDGAAAGVVGAGGLLGEGADGGGEDGVKGHGELPPGHMGTMGNQPMCPLLLGCRGRPTPAQDRANRLKWMQMLAQERGGECLSEEYRGLKKKLRLRCAEGHEWETIAENVVRGHWCRKCQGEKRKLTLEDMRQTAALHGGVCLSTEYKGSSTKLLWQCRNGHEFWLAPNNVRRAPGSRRKPSWCPTCGPKRGPKPSSRPPPPPQKPPRLSSRGKVLGRPRGSTKQKNAERRRSKETEVLGKSLVRGGVADALKSKLDATGLEALDYLVKRYLVRPKPNAMPKDSLLRIIAEVGEEMGA